MNESRAGRTVILGLGNPVLSDDRVGLAVAEEVERRLHREPEGIADVAYSVRGGFELIDLLSGYSRAILIDCLFVPHPEPGALRTLGIENVGGSARLVGAHELSLANAFDFARANHIPMPNDVTIFGIEGADLTLLSETMTPPVAAAVVPLADRICAMLRNS